MGTITLTARDTTVLQLLADAPATGDQIAETIEYSSSELTDRLEELAENGLLWEREDGTYALTESGSRVLDVPADGSTDSRIDASDEVTQAIEGSDLRPDREEAVFDAFAFLHYWGEASESELIDGIYSENPAGYETTDEWWQEFMRDTLAGLPTIESPTGNEEPWRYTGTPTIEARTADGRRPFKDPTTYGSVKHALEALDLSAAQHAAVHTVFETLQQRRTATVTEFEQDVYNQVNAEDLSADEWWTQWIEPVLFELPGIEQMDGNTWRYTGDTADNGVRTHSDETSETITDETGTDTVCPVCQQSYDGRVYIAAGETRLSGWAIPVCITTGPADTPAGADITLYYHGTPDAERSEEAK